MLILKSLKFQNIGRFVEEQSIDFTSLGSLIQIDGQNLNTGGSSGAGKSTVFKALEFLLGLNNISNNILQSRLTKESMSVTGIFEVDGVPLTLRRDKKLYIDFNGEVITGSSKLTEEKLEEIIGMPTDLFRKILHKRQGEGGFFLDMGPSGVHEFLTNCLSLQKEEAKIATLDDKMKILTKKELDLKSLLESNKTGLQATESAISSLGSPPLLEVGLADLKELKDKHFRYSEDHKSLKELHKKEIELLEADRPIVFVNPFDRAKIEVLETEITNLYKVISYLNQAEHDRKFAIQNKISDLNSEIAKLNSIELSREYDVKEQISQKINKSKELRQKELNRINEIENKSIRLLSDRSKTLVEIKNGEMARQDVSVLLKELNKIRSLVCPTCEQSWTNEASKSKEQEILDKIQKCKNLAIAGMEASKRFDSIENEIRLNQEEAKPTGTVEEKILLEEISQLRIELQPKEIPEIFEIKTKIDQLSSELNKGSTQELIDVNLKLDDKNKELAVLRKEEQNHQLKENSRNQMILSEFTYKQNALRASHKEALQVSQDLEYRSYSEVMNANNKIKAFEEADKRFQESVRKLTDQASIYKAKIQSAIFDLSNVQEELELATESKKAIKSYLSSSFEDALESIGDMATRLIRSIPNMSTATIEFEGLKETAQGKVKEEVNCMVSMDGEIGVPIKSLSGGERSTVDIGIDLSVIKFIEERTGKGIDLFILDEFTNGLDTVCIENAIEMLKNSNIDKRLFLVEHNPIASQSIENRLMVIRDGLTSKIVQQ